LMIMMSHQGTKAPKSLSFQKDLSFLVSWCLGGESFLLFPWCLGVLVVMFSLWGRGW
jgi:hypothetical protein